MKKDLGNWRVWLAAMILMLGTSSAQAAFHLFRIQQIYSNADGTVQFVVLSTGYDGEDQWTGQHISSTDVHGTRSYRFPNFLPSNHTGGHSVLVATQGFANLGIVAPDYVIPNNFIATGEGSVDFAGVDSVSYLAGQLPTDGINALLKDGTTAKNLATNFAGASASVAGTGTPASANYQGLWWAAGGTESGWGINFVHQGDQIFATWYTYDTAGKAWWLSMLAGKTTGTTYTGTINATAGSPFNTLPFPPVTAPPKPVGTGTLTFADANNGSFAYTVNTTPPQTKAISRYDLGTGAQPTCTYSAATPNFAAATNYQDLWWVANSAESGWGINFAHQGNSVFATWYTYDVDGTPLWLSVLAGRVGTSNVYTGNLYRTSGPRYDAYDAAKWMPAQVGTATLTFTDGNHAKFDYATNGNGALPSVTQSKQVTRFPFAATGGTLCQ